MSGVLVPEGIDIDDTAFHHQDFYAAIIIDISDLSLPI